MIKGFRLSRTINSVDYLVLNKKFARRKKTEFVIVHCSDSDQKTHDNPKVIHKWHLLRGFTSIGYHFVITKDGVIHFCRPLWATGSHSRGQNSKSIGVCLTGRDAFSRKQFISLAKLLNLIGLKAYPHNKFDKSKTCPNFDLKKVLSIYDRKN